MKIGLNNMKSFNTKKLLKNKYYPKDLIPHVLRTCGCENAKRVLDANKAIQDNIKRNNGQLIGSIKT